MKSSQKRPTSHGKNRLILENICLNRLKSTVAKRVFTSSILPLDRTCWTYNSKSALLDKSKEMLSLRNQNNLLSGTIFIWNPLKCSISDRIRYSESIAQL